MQSALDNGVILKSDIDVLTSEKIKLEQQISENEIRKTSFLKILSDLTVHEIDDFNRICPSSNNQLNFQGNYHVLNCRYLTCRKEQLDAGLQIAKAKECQKHLDLPLLVMEILPEAISSRMNLHLIIFLEQALNGIFSTGTRQKMKNR